MRRRKRVWAGPFVSREPEYPPDPTPPPFRFSIQHDKTRWVLSTEYKGVRLAWWFSESAALIDHLEAVTTQPVCYACGSPLATVNGRVVCIRNLEHYPQPEEITVAAKPQWRWSKLEPPTIDLPEIIPARFPLKDDGRIARLNRWLKNGWPSGEVGNDG